jgi:hypothetical protein
MLRKIFNECDSLKIFIEKEQDAGEFLTMLFGVFDELDVCVRREEKYSTTDEDTPMKELDVSEMQQVDTYMSNHNTNPNQYVENYIIEGNDSEAFFRISDFLFKFNERKYKVNNKNIRIIAIEKIISTPYLVFNIQRLGVRDVVSKKIIIPDEIIYIGDDSILEFTGVVIYHNRHYTCFFSCRKIWYFFNDIAPPSEKIKKIGPYNKLMEKAGEVITQKGTIYFYSKMFENMA